MTLIETHQAPFGILVLCRDTEGQLRLVTLTDGLRQVEMNSTKITKEQWLKLTGA